LIFNHPRLVHCPSIRVSANMTLFDIAVKWRPSIVKYSICSPIVRTAKM